MDDGKWKTGGRKEVAVAVAVVVAVLTNGDLGCTQIESFQHIVGKIKYPISSIQCKRSL